MCIYIAQTRRGTGISRRRKARIRLNMQRDRTVLETKFALSSGGIRLRKPPLFAPVVASQGARVNLVEKGGGMEGADHVAARGSVRPSSLSGIVLALFIAPILVSACNPGADLSPSGGLSCHDQCRGTNPPGLPNSDEGYRQCMALCQRSSPPPSPPTTTPRWSVHFWLNAYIPGNIPNYTRVLTGGPFAGQTVVPVPFMTTYCALTDQRSASSSYGASARMRSDAVFDVGASGFTRFVPDHLPGVTTEVVCVSGVRTCSEQARRTGMGWGTPNRDASSSWVSLEVAANNPCTPGSASPPIKYDGVVMVTPARRLIEFIGHVSEFPAFEAYASINGGAPQRLFHRFDSNKRVDDLLSGRTVDVYGSAPMP
jgi:hypothetical protein